MSIDTFIRVYILNICINPAQGIANPEWSPIPVVLGQCNANGLLVVDFSAGLKVELDDLRALFQPK